MYLKTLISVVIGLVLFCASSAHACLIAHQSRTFVLGSSGPEVFVLEIAQRRDGDLETSDEWHFMTPTLLAVQFGGDGTINTRTVLHTDAETKIQNGNERKWLQNTFDTYYQRASKRPGFEAAVIEERLECDYLTTCDAFRTVSSGILGPKPNVRRIEPPATITKAKGPIHNFEGWGIDQVEFLKIGSKKFARITVGVGHDMDPCEVLADTTGCASLRKQTTLPTPKSLRAGVDHKRALHHGTEWDVLFTFSP